MMADGTRQGAQLHSFIPDAQNDRLFRTALGQFGTGVTVITAQTAKGPIGMTANSFSSVSMEPPLVLWCPAKSSSRYAHFIEARHFAIHVLGAAHEGIALAFAKSGQAFDTLDAAVNSDGVPIFDNCLARFECDTHAIHNGGDHSIVLGQVTRAAFREGEALVFCQGHFGGFGRRT
jgi:flavin reductase (DIM6/NTAB) family NADH-FMN oxidoreductase RutF